jgi:hypothetical protein
LLNPGPGSKVWWSLSATFSRAGPGYSAAMEALTHGGNHVMRYLAILKAARDFGVHQHEIEAIAGGFDPRRPRCAELADALADLIVARTEL